MVLGTSATRDQYQEIKKVHVDPEIQPSFIVRWLKGGAAEFPDETGIYHPEGIMAIEDFLPGESVFWTFWHSEFHYVLKGKAEIVYSLAPWYDEEKSVTVGPGDAYLLPFGSNVTFKISPEGPMRHMCVVMPRQTWYGEVPPKNIIRLR
jgi:mannose-6-phosphate isomerase-like protein (cupin superfamily)